MKLTPAMIEAMRQKVTACEPVRRCAGGFRDYTDQTNQPPSDNDHDHLPKELDPESRPRPRFTC
jgi:hypothetical protein